MCKFVFKMVPKNIKNIVTTDCGAHSLMSHLTKLLLRIMNQTMRIKIRYYLKYPKHSFGFISEIGTRNVILLFTMMIERYLKCKKRMCTSDSLTSQKLSIEYNMKNFFF